MFILFSFSPFLFFISSPLLLMFTDVPSFSSVVVVSTVVLDVTGAVATLGAGAGGGAGFSTGGGVAGGVAGFKGSLFLHDANNNMVSAPKVIDSLFMVKYFSGINLVHYSVMLCYKPNSF